jgi:hypothetical protein
MARLNFRGQPQAVPHVIGDSATALSSKGTGTGQRGCDAALEQVVEDDQPLQEVAAEAVDLLDGQQVAVADVGQRVQQRGPVPGGELAADLLLEDLQADRIKCVVPDTTFAPRPMPRSFMAFSQVIPRFDPKNFLLGRANAAGTGTTNRIPSTAVTSPPPHACASGRFACISTSGTFAKLNVSGRK